MNVILDVVREEIASVERELEQELEKRLGPLREIETLALQLNGAEPEPAPKPVRAEQDALESERARREERARAATKERRKRRPGGSEPAAPRPPRKLTDEEIEAAADKMLPLGHCTPNRIMHELESKSTPVRRRVESLLARREADGRIVPDSPVRGHASFKLPEDAPSPEPEAPAPTTDDVGAYGDGPLGVTGDPERTSDSGASDEEPKEEAAEEWVGDDELDGYEKARTNGKGGETIGPDMQPLADRIKAAVLLEAKPTRAIAEMLGEDVKQIRRLTEKMVRMGILQQRGYTAQIDGGNPMYRATPTLEERGVTVRTADRETPLEQRVLTAIDENGPLSIPGLAAKVVEPPREVAAAVNALIEKREVKKTRAHPDAVYGRPEAQAAWGRGVTV